MARSPFQGTWSPAARPTVVHGPDTLVYINGETDVLGCPSCQRRFDFNKYITSVSVDLNVENAPGSATISMAVPRHTVDEFYFDGNPIVTPMMEVEVFAKGYFLMEGLPQYYPIFWGLVTEVGDSYSGGEHTVSINCEDILKWWELCRMNINPAFTQAVGQQGRSIFGNVFFGMNPYDIIWTLAQVSFGDIVVGSGSLMSLYKEAQQKATFNVALTDIMIYWEQRFKRMRSNLLLYGSQGKAVRGDTLYEIFRKHEKVRSGLPFASSAVRKANGGATGGQMVYDPTDPNVTAFRTQFSQAGQVNFWQSEYQTKLELANSAKEAIGYEFYMDVTGDIVFKPPFFNLDVLANKPVSWIQDIDVIDWDFSESEAEVVTQLTIQGSYGGNVDYGMPEEATPFTSVTDYHLLRKYGWRPQTLSSEFLGSMQLMFYVGMDHLDRTNSKRHRATVTIPCRPELRLGFPVYVAPKDQVWYISGISHNIQMGGRATTTLTLTAKRQKFIAPQGIGKLRLSSYNGDSAVNVDEGAQYTSRDLAQSATFRLDIGRAASIPASNPDLQINDESPYAPLVLRHPKTGRLMGYPNVTLVYTRPFTPSPEALEGVAGRNPEGLKKQLDKRKKQVDAIESAGLQQLREMDERYAHNFSDDLREKYIVNRYSYGLNSAGVYTYAHDASLKIQEILLLPRTRLQAYQDDALVDIAKTKQGSALIQPVSDERGFEVVGHFRYGRGLSLRDGMLIPTQSGKFTAANIDAQLALSGNLLSVLRAQSAGLTTITSPYPNPAYAVANLSPEDVETAAIIHPDTGLPTIFDPGNNFVNPQSTVIGAPQDQNLPASVEATQLSRALTLAEMHVKEMSIQDEEVCSCLTARSDLAFMNVGYQVKTIPQAASDLSALPSQQGGGSTYFGAFGQDVVPIEESGLNVTEEERAAIELQEAVTGSTGIVDQVDAQRRYTYEQAFAENRPVSPNLLAKSLEETVDRVDQFLFTLYSALDEPHYEYEKAIRGGEAEVVGPVFVEGETLQDSIEPAPELAPPYSASSRAALGDPRATAVVASEAVGDIQDAYSAFGNALSDVASRTLAQQEIARLSQQRAQTQAELDAYLDEKARGVAQDDVDDDIRRTREALAKLDTEIDNKRAKV